MPRVLVTGFCAVPGPRRSGVQLRHVIRALTPLHSLDLLVLREGDQGYVERQGSVRVLRVPMNETDPRAQIQAFQRALKRQLEGAEYDVVHCRDAWSAVTALEARARGGYAVVYDLTRSPLGTPWPTAEIEAQHARDEVACLRTADLVLAPTEAAVAALSTRVPGDRLVLSPPGVDVDRFDWDVAPKPGAARIVYVGALDTTHGLHALLRAMVPITREVEARLVLAGPPAQGGTADPAIRDAIRELRTESCVELLGPVEHEQVPMLIASATVCVALDARPAGPASHGMFATKILEYLACRRPVVAARGSSAEAAITDGHDGLLFVPDDPVDLSRTLLRLLRDASLRDRLASVGYERVRRDHTASAARRAVRHAYDRLADRFAAQLTAEASDDAPKVETLADDDFEATVCEEAPAPDTAVRPVVTAVHGRATLDDGLTVDDGTNSRSVPARAAPADDWVVTNVGGVVSALYDESSLDIEVIEEEGTPLEGVQALAAPLGLSEGMFVAGEIDLSAPPVRSAASPTEENPAISDPDTGTRNGASPAAATTGSR